MSHRILLYLNAHQVSACRWQAGRISKEESFPASDAGHARFAAYLEQNKQSVFSLLANIADEGFHIETIPFLQGSDRRTVINRKLEQIFFNPPFGASLSLGREKNRRKDERILLAALTSLAPFHPWVNIIQSSEVALSGLYSLPLLAPSLLRKLGLHHEPCLLLTVQDQSIRQSYFDKGELNFSRLTPLQDSSVAGIAQTFAAESAKLQQYLVSQRIINRNQPITAHILAHPDAWRTIQNSCIDTPNLRYNILDITKCSKKTGLRTPPADTHCESLFLHLLVTHPPKIQFADQPLRHHFKVRQIRSLLWGTGAVALAASLLLSGRLLFDTRETERKTETLRSEAQTSRQRYTDIVKTFPPVPVDNETLKASIDRYLVQESRSLSPIGLYDEVSRALQANPEIEIERLDWKIGGSDADAANPNRQTSSGKPVPDDSESITVHGRFKLAAPNVNTRQLLTTFGRFVESLKVNPKLQVEILQKPFDIESGKPLRSGDATPGEGGQSRSFSLQIIRKIES